MFLALRGFGGSGEWKGDCPAGMRGFSSFLSQKSNDASVFFGEGKHQAAVQPLRRGRPGGAER